MLANFRCNLLLNRYIRIHHGGFNQLECAVKQLYFVPLTFTINEEESKILLDEEV